MRTTTLITTLVLAAGLAAATARAADPPSDGKKVTVEVLVIRATTKNKDISPELKELADKLRKQFKYTGFKLEKRLAGTTDLGVAYKTPLIGDYEAAITPQKREGKRLTLQMRVAKKGEDKPKLDMSATIPAGEFQLTGGWDLDGGDALIVGFAGK
jgi:hypothetical protein